METPVQAMMASVEATLRGASKELRLEVANTALEAGKKSAEDMRNKVHVVAKTEFNDAWWKASDAYRAAYIRAGYMLDSDYYKEVKQSDMIMNKETEAAKKARDDVLNAADAKYHREMADVYKTYYAILTGGS
jgi:hypothetical protein